MSPRRKLGETVDGLPAPISRRDAYIIGAMIGLLAAQSQEPNTQWAAQWAVEQGERALAEADKARA